MSRGVTLAGAIIAIALSAHAAALTGRVADENNAGVAQARVTFHSASGDTSALCDPTGAFSIELPPGHYTARAEHEGFFPLKDFPIDIAEDTRELHLTLNHVREVSESLNVHESTGAVDVDKIAAERKLTGLEMIDVPYAPTRDLRAALTLMPGVLQDPSGSLHFDGAAEGQTLYLLDGFNFSDPLTGKLNTRVSVESVRTIDWASGRYSAEFGKGSGGALAIHTDMGDDRWRYSSTNFLPGFDTRGGFHLGTWAPRFNISGPVVPGRLWFSEHLDLEYSVPVAPDLPRGQDRTQVFQGSNLARVQANLTPSQILFADVLVDYTFAPRTGLDALDPLSTTADRRSHTWFASLKDQIYLKHGMLLEVGYAQDLNYLRVVPQGDQFYQLTPYARGGNFYLNSEQRSRRGQFLANLFLPAVGKHQWKIGADLDRLRYWQDARRTGINVYDVAGALVRQTIFGGSGLLAQAGSEASWYAMDHWKIRPDLLIEYGIRQDWDQVLRQAAFSPRASVAWAPFGSKDTKISAGYAVVRDATPLELFTRPRDQFAIQTLETGASYTTSFEIPDPRLKAPLYQNWTVGLEQRFGHRFDLTLTGLRKRGDDGLAYIPAATGVYTLANARHDAYAAMEVALHQRFGEAYEWMASYTRSRAYSNAVIDVTVDQPLEIFDNSGPVAWDAPNRFVSWGYLPTKWRNWAIGYSAEMRTGFPYSRINDFGQVVGAVDSQRFPRFFTLNIHPEWKFNAFGRRWALRGGVNNVTNRNNPTLAQTLPGMPVQFFGSEGRHFVVRIRWLGKAM
ncbi:MAG: TonB-dependent receptor [Acidobacteriia bacterium]|nr:TonB-dependent receptor [Terriglobia bacterium]